MPLPLLITCHNFTEHVLRQKPAKPSRLKPRLPQPPRHSPCSRVHHPFLRRDLRAQAGRVPAGSEAAGVCTALSYIPGLADSPSLTPTTGQPGKGRTALPSRLSAKEQTFLPRVPCVRDWEQKKRVGRHEHSDSKKWFGLPILSYLLCRKFKANNLVGKKEKLGAEWNGESPDHTAWARLLFEIQPASGKADTEYWPPGLLSLSCHFK